MASTSLQFNGLRWRTVQLGEETILLSLEEKPPDRVEAIRTSSKRIQSVCKLCITDIVPAYDSISLFIDLETTNPDELMKLLADNAAEVPGLIAEPRKYEIPVCYDRGLDWEDVIASTGLSRQEVIGMHQEDEYQVAMIGFLPGFTYLSGMNPSISCPRRANPRVRVPAGAIGIGGSQTGIYSFACPGGWQIIGQAPVTLFHMDNVPFSLLEVGDRVSFRPIDLETYEALISKHLKGGQ